MPYTYLEHVATADTAFEATGKDLTELFTSAAEAVIHSMADSKTVKPTITKELEFKNTSIEKLLYDFLEEIVFLKDSEAIVFHDVTCVVEEGYTLRATLHGEPINHKTQDLHQDVKAVTMHYFTVEETDDGWRAQVVLDI